MGLIPKITMRFDPRFTLEQNWEQVVLNVKECQERGLLVTPLTVFDSEGKIIGWYLHGWVTPPAKLLWSEETGVAQ